MVAAAQSSGQVSVNRARRESLRAIVHGMVATDLVWRVDRTDLSHFGATGLSRHKVICETALLLVVAHRDLCGDGRLVSAIQVFLAKAMDLTVDAQMLLDLDRYPQTASSIALLLLAARAYGVPCAIERHVETAFRSPFFLSAERVPFRIQEAHWLRERILPDFEPWQTDSHGALFDRWQHPAVLSRDDLYAITHSAMYLSDFGQRRMCSKLEEQSMNVRHGIAMSFANADWDLLGELLLTARYLSLPKSSIERAGEEILWSIYDRHGLVPGLGYRASDAERHAGSDHQFYQFLQSYHSTLVLALLACAPPHIAEPMTGNYLPANAMEAIFAARGLASIDPIGRNVSDNWYGDEVDIDAEMLIDGMAICCFRTHGRKAAIELLNAVPSCHGMPMVDDTLSFLAGEQPASSHVERNRAQVAANRALVSG